MNEEVETDADGNPIAANVRTGKDIDGNPINAAGLRTDGPTLAEWEAKGYSADAYPPNGFAVRVSAPLPNRPAPRPAPLNEGKTDALSVAARQKTIVAPPPAPAVKAPYHLEYDYNGEHIKESHSTIEQALAGIRRLKVLGITPATSTDPGTK